MTPLGSLLPWLDLAGLAVFAASGALAAAQARQTITTFAFFAAVTGTGGGTLRDLLIGAPVFWLRDPAPVAVCLAMAVAVWASPRHWWQARALDWLDAAGLAAYAVYGAAKSLAFGVSPLPAALLGVVSACMGGVIRDVLAGVPSVIIRPELYVTAAVAAATVHVALVAAGLPGAIAGLLAAALGFTLRALAITRGLALPAYRP